MNYTIEHTEEETIIRFPNPVSDEAIKSAISYFRFLELTKNMREIPQEEADEVLASIKKGIGRRTRAFLAGKPGFEHWSKPEEE